MIFTDQISWPLFSLKAIKDVPEYDVSATIINPWAIKGYEID